MNSYGDSQSPRARARVPGSGASAPDDDLSSGRYSSSARPAPDAYRRGAGGRASVGSVTGSAPAGRASVGSASVGGATGSARVGGRASVGTGSGTVGARASVARAAVRPGPGGPGGPDGFGGTGNVKDRSKAAKRRRRTNILTAAAAVVVILLGAGVVGGTYFFDSVQLPEAKTEDQSNVIKYANGDTLAKIGEQNRTVVPESQINKYVKDAVIAAEDKNFRNHHGIDMKGIVRAAWNNFTGGATQGASTITQQYARHVADLKDISINRKLREAVIARKLETQYNKDEILGMYLNFIDLGEGRYGIEAAAQGYFGKSVTKPAGKPGAITPYEAAVLASIIKQPYPDKNSLGYDPNYNPTGARERWDYTMKNMLDLGAITPAQYQARKYPTVRKRGTDTCTTCAANTPAGMIIRHVKAELIGMGIDPTEQEKGGLTITTTIDPQVQKAAEEAGSAKSESSPMHGRPKTYQAAVIGIDPNTGRVLGYYAGDSPTGIDYGGYMSDDPTKGYPVTGGQSPGSSFKIYTLAAGLMQGASFDSVWDAQQRRRNGTKINNAGADDNSLCNGRPRSCDLETATIKSYNFPFYWLADEMGREKVIEAAKAAGIKHMFTDSGKIVDLSKTDASTWKKTGYFDDEVAFGQYRVVPLEHAEGVATIINGGVHHAAHFIRSVKRVIPETGKVETLNPENVQGKRVFGAAEMSNLDGVLAKVVTDHGRNLRNGRESIAKSGTWEFDDGKDSHTGSGDCWFVGGIPQMAVTVWVGGKDKKVELHESTGKDMFGAGTPARIWKQFIDSVTKAMDWKQVDFPPRQTTGEKDKFGNGIKLPDLPQGGNCALSLFGVACNDPGNNNNGPGGNNGPGNNGPGNNGNGNGGNGGNGDNNGGVNAVPFGTASPGTG